MIAHFRVYVIQNDVRGLLRASQRAAFREGLTTATSLTFSSLFESPLITLGTGGFFWLHGTLFKELK